MTVWDELKASLFKLSDSVIRWPDVRLDEDMQPPFRIGLAPGAISAAEELHRRFGDDVELVVGFLRYPDRKPWRISPKGEDIPKMDPTEMSVELDAPIIVASGHTVRGALRVRNLSAHTIVLLPHEHVTTQVVNPQTGDVVGGFCGERRGPSCWREVHPASTIVVGVVIGTASVSPDLGYVVPAGKWAIQVILELEDENATGWQRGTDRPGRRRVRTPLLPITVTD
jgi:hypothetical protein